MDALADLRQLVRIAEQDDRARAEPPTATACSRATAAPPRRRTGRRPRPSMSVARPQPGRPAPRSGLAGRRAPGDDVVVIGRRRRSPVRRRCPPRRPDFWIAANGGPGLGERLRRPCRARLRDRLVRLGGDPDLPACRDEGRDHPGARSTSCRSRVALDRQDAVGRGRARAGRRRPSGSSLVGTDARRRRLPAERREAGRVRASRSRAARVREPVGRSMPRSSTSSAIRRRASRQRLGLDRLARDERDRMAVQLGRRPVEVDRARRCRRSRRPRRRQRRSRRPARSPVADPDLVILRRESVAPDARPVAAPRVGLERQAAEALARLDQLVDAELVEPVEVPPLGLRVAAVPVEELGEQPPAALLGAWPSADRRERPP